MPSKTPKKPAEAKPKGVTKSAKNVIGMFLIFATCFIIVGIMAVMFKKQRMIPTVLLPPTLPPAVVMPSSVPTVPTYESKDENPATIENPTVIETMDTLIVKWQRPVKVALKDVVTLPTVTSTAKDDYMNQWSIDPLYTLSDDLYLRGTVTSGSLLNAKVYVFKGMSRSEMGGGPDHELYHLIVTKEGKHASMYSGEVINAKPEDGFATHYQIQNAVMPEALTLQNGKKLMKEPYNYSFLTTDCYQDVCTGYKKIATTKEGFSVFNLEDLLSDIKYVVSEDGRVHSYASAISYDMNDESTGISKISNKNFTWMAAYASNTANYTRFYRGGCGFALPENVMTEQMVSEKDLVEIGTVTKTGEKIYGVKSLGIHPEIIRAYENWYEYDARGEKPAIDVFLQRYPVPFFIWKNAFGENVRYVTSDTVPPGECGKPVIYLYPEKTTSVSVRLDPSINVTVSEPTYPSSGWTVIAEPNGQLTYQGQTYGSLFWEGTGVNYQVPSTGFILKDGEVDQQLKNILAKYGLNERESAEFREFWVPLMTGAPYYRVSFIETQEWNKAAPLYVQPKPKSVIRIFMDWQKLHKPTTIIEPEIKTPVRDGFTLVEWGGLLRK